MSTFPDQDSLFLSVKNNKPFHLQDGLSPFLSKEASGERSAFFRNDLWPGLVLYACEEGSYECLRVLCSTTFSGEKAAFPLPAHTLGWILAGFEKNKRTARSISVDVLPSLLDRLKQSPVDFRPQDGLRVIKMGGLETAFFFTQAPYPQATEVFRLPSVQLAWRAWCRCSLNLDSALSLLFDVSVRTQPNSSDSFHRALAHALESSTPKLRSVFSNKLCQLLLNAEPDVATDRSMGFWLGWFLRTGTPLEHPVWLKWGADFCSRLENHSEGESNVADDWSFVLLYRAHASTTAPPGWVWNDNMARRFLSARSCSVRELLDEHAKGHWSSDQKLAQAGTFFREMLLAWETLERWGLVQPREETAWKNSFSEILGCDWEARFQDLLDAEAGSPHIRDLLGHWALWRARSLRLALDQAMKDPESRKRVRL